MEILGIGALAGGIGVFVGALFAHLTRPVVTFVLALFALAAMVGFLVAGEQAQGWDAIGYAVVAFVIAGPMGVGLALGGALVWIVERRGAKAGG
jgi:hypothetical protein